jgi:type II secretory pathway predicted ATPase ExeA
MYHAHFGLTEAPFRITPHTDFFFAGARRGATLQALIYAITHDEGIVKVGGEVGTGKTMLCRMLMEQLPPTVVTVYLANPLLARGDILYAIADELDCTLPPGRSSAALRALQAHLIRLYGEGKQVVLLVDEAHAMPADTLEEIRLLSNLESQRHKLMQIVLFGQPELDEILGRTAMRQLKDRIAHHFALVPLVHTDVAAYIDFRMRAAGYRGPSVFTPTAIRRIAQASGGLTRRINMLADKSLLAAFAANRHAVGTEEAKAAIRDAHLDRGGRYRAVRWLGGAGAAAVVAGIVVFGGLRTQPPTPAVAAPAAPMVQEHGAAAPAPAAATNLELPPSAGAIAVAALQRPAARTATERPPLPKGILGPLTREYLDRTGTWLATTAGERWFLQLLTTDLDHAGKVELFVAQAAAMQVGDRLRVYLADVSGTRRLGVIYGDFASLADARAALDELPPPLRTSGPYPRRVSQLSAMPGVATPPTDGEKR